MLTIDKILTNKKLVSLGQFIRFAHYEPIFKFVFFSILVVTVLNIQDIIAFRNYAYLNGIQVVDLNEFKFVPAVWCFLYISKSTFRIFLGPYVFENLQAKYKGDERMFRSRKVLRWMYDFFVYTSTSVFVWKMFHKEDWYPSELGGEGNCQNIISNYPEKPDNDVLIKFYLFQLAMHSYSTIELIIMGKELEIKFWEYLLHHYIASALIFVSLNLNIIKLGVVVMIIHDLADIFVCCGKAYTDLRFSKISIVSLAGFLMLSSWLYTRLFVYPMCVIKTNFEFISLLKQNSVWDNIKYAWIFQTILMCFLQSLHIYWSIYMIKGVGAIFKTGKAINIYDNKENKVDVKFSQQIQKKYN